MYELWPKQYSCFLKDYIQRIERIDQPDGIQVAKTFLKTFQHLDVSKLPLQQQQQLEAKVEELKKLVATKVHVEPKANQNTTAGP